MPDAPVTSSHASFLLKALLGLAALAICALVCFFAYVMLLDSRAKPLKEPLAKLIPADFDNWTSQDLPVAQSEEMQSRVSNILKYDDILTRNYTGPGLAISLYVAYWNPGKVPVSEAGMHTPDTCWVSNGWSASARENDCKQTVRGQELKPFEYGVYTKDGRTEYVIFWHLVGDWTNHMQYEGWRNGLKGRLERLPFLFQSFRQFGLNQRREQLFIRMSSPGPFDVLWGNPHFLDFIEHMKPLRIFESAPTP